MEANYRRKYKKGTTLTRSSGVEIHYDAADLRGKKNTGVNSGASENELLSEENQQIQAEIEARFELFERVKRFLPGKEFNPIQSRTELIKETIATRAPEVAEDLDGDLEANFQALEMFEELSDKRLDSTENLNAIRAKICAPYDGR